VVLAVIIITAKGGFVKQAISKKYTLHSIHYMQYTLHRKNYKYT